MKRIGLFIIFGLLFTGCAKLHKPRSNRQQQTATVAVSDTDTVKVAIKYIILHPYKRIARLRSRFERGTAEIYLKNGKVLFFDYNVHDNNSRIYAELEPGDAFLLCNGAVVGISRK